MKRPHRKPPSQRPKPASPAPDPPVPCLLCGGGPPAVVGLWEPTPSARRRLGPDAPAVIIYPLCAKCFGDGSNRATEVEETLFRQLGGTEPESEPEPETVFAFGYRVGHTPPFPPGSRADLFDCHRCKSPMWSLVDDQYDGPDFRVIATCDDCARAYLEDE